MVRRHCFYLLFIIISLFCAHKAPPLRIDRVDPKLTRVIPFYSHQIILNFSEEIDSLSMNPENFLIYTEKETLEIIYVTHGNTPDQIFIFTPTMRPGEYNLQGRVYDRSGRSGFFKTKFISSTKKDTIPPLPVSYSKGPKSKKFVVEYSEPMDTSSLKFYIVPAKKIPPIWRNLKTLLLDPGSDSFNYDTTYYLFIQEIKDLAGNAAPPFITTITPDSLYKPLFIRGKAVVNDTPLINGIGILTRTRPLGISTVEKGEFLFEVRDSSNYYLQILGANCYGADSVSVVKENLIKLLPGVVNLDSLIY